MLSLLLGAARRSMQGSNCARHLRPLSSACRAAAASSSSPSSAAVEESDSGSEEDVKRRLRQDDLRPSTPSSSSPPPRSSPPPLPPPRSSPPPLPPLPPPSSSSSSSSPPIDFEDTATSFASIRTPQLLRSSIVLGSCAFSPPWLVGAAAAAYGPEGGKGLFAFSRRAAVDAVLARSLYPHFCAGATAEEASRVADRLAEAGVGSILNYAAEEAVEDDDDENENKTKKDPDASRDAAATLFLASVARARPSPREGRPVWIAVKVSALVPPLVLERASAAVVQASEEAARAAKSDAPLFDRGALACDETFDRLLTRAVDSGRLSEEDVAALRRGEERLRSIGAAASRRGNTRVIVDAEQSWLQPQIDVLALRAMREFNKQPSSDPTIVQTYQCYLKSAPRRVAADALRARLEGFTHGAKPVRGAYLTAERSSAVQRGLPDPVHGTIQDTHTCYDSVVGSLLDGVKEKKTHLLIASHNRSSIESAVAGLCSRGLDPKTAPVSFGQLLGMADSLTFGLASRDFDALKILAYGDLRVVCAFLVRRAQENASALGGARAESEAQAREVARRLFGLRK